MHPMPQVPKKSGDTLRTAVICVCNLAAGLMAWHAWEEPVLPDPNSPTTRVYPGIVNEDWEYFANEAGVTCLPEP